MEIHGNTFISPFSQWKLCCFTFCRTQQRAGSVRIFPGCSGFLQPGRWILAAVKAASVQECRAAQLCKGWVAAWLSSALALHLSGLMHIMFPWRVVWSPRHLGSAKWYLLWLIPWTHWHAFIHEKGKATSLVSESPWDAMHVWEKSSSPHCTAGGEEWGPGQYEKPICNEGTHAGVFTPAAACPLAALILGKGRSFLKPHRISSKRAHHSGKASKLWWKC